MAARQKPYTTWVTELNNILVFLWSNKRRTAGNTMAEFESVDAAHLAQLREVMEGEYVDLLQTYLDNAPKELGRMHNGLWSKDYNTITLAAHTLKGSSSNIGAVRLAQMFKELEHASKQQQPFDVIGETFERIQQEYQLVCAALVQEITKTKSTR